MKKRIAIFRDSDCHFDTPCDDSCVPKGYIKVTEWVDIDFPERNEAARITDEVNYINEKIDGIKEDTIKKINELSIRREELLALEVNT